MTSLSFHCFTLFKVGGSQRVVGDLGHELEVLGLFFIPTYLLGLLDENELFPICICCSDWEKEQRDKDTPSFVSFGPT